MPLLCILTIYGQYPASLHPKSPLGAQLVAAVDDDLMAAASFIYCTVGNICNPQLDVSDLLCLPFCISCTLHQ